MLLLVLALQTAVPAPPATPPSPAVDASAKRICKSEGETYSRISRKRVCRTAAEWEEISRDMQRQARAGTNDRIHDRP